MSSASDWSRVVKLFKEIRGCTKPSPAKESTRPRQGPLRFERKARAAFALTLIAGERALVPRAPRHFVSSIRAKIVHFREAGTRSATLRNSTTMNRHAAKMEGVWGLWPQETFYNRYFAKLRPNLD